MTRRYAACIIAAAFCVLSLVAVAAKEPDKVDVAIEHGLEYLLAVQKESGAYPGQHGDTVAIPALAAMACLATGHVPGDAKYGTQPEQGLYSAASSKTACTYGNTTTLRSGMTERQTKSSGAGDTRC